MKKKENGIYNNTPVLKTENYSPCQTLYEYSKCIAYYHRYYRIL